MTARFFPLIETWWTVATGMDARSIADWRVPVAPECFNGGVTVAVVRARCGLTPGSARTRTAIWASVRGIAL